MKRLFIALALLMVSTVSAEETVQIMPKKCCAVPEPGQTQSIPLGGDTQDCDSHCGGGGVGTGGGVDPVDTSDLCWDWTTTGPCAKHFVTGFPDRAAGFQCAGEATCSTQFPKR